MAFCKEQDVLQSMSKPDCHYNNTPMEKYYNTLKAELIKMQKHESQEELFNTINMYAYSWYNNMRPQNYNGGLPPKKVA